MIGIIGAMKIEIDTINGMIENKKTEKYGIVEYTSGKLFGRDVVTAVCGIGKVNAAICAQTMILKYSPDVIINTGVGGSLSTELQIGDIAVAESLVEHDMDTSPIGDPVGFISGLGIVNIPADAKTVDKMIEGISSLGGIKAVKGVIASGDQFIADPTVKDRIVSSFGAIACEMEGASIGHVCYASGVPFAVVRAVSDCADGSSHMDYPTFLPIAANNAAKLIEYFVKNS